MRAISGPAAIWPDASVAHASASLKPVSTGRAMMPFHQHLVVGLVTLALCGCAARYNPVPLYPRDSRSEPDTAMRSRFFVEKEPPIFSGRTPNYADAVEYAQALARAYRHAQAVDAGRTDALGVLVLGTGAAGIGLGLAGTTGDPFIALGTATGAGVG